MICRKCGHSDCSCALEADKINTSRYQREQGFGNNDAWSQTPPKTTNVQPRIEVGQWNNTPNQPKLENK